MAKQITWSQKIRVGETAVIWDTGLKSKGSFNNESTTQPGQARPVWGFSILRESRVGIGGHEKVDDFVQNLAEELMAQSASA